MVIPDKLTRLRPSHHIFLPFGLIAPLVINGPMNGVIFKAYVEQMLAPSLNAGDIVIMDNLASVPHGHWKTTTFVAGLRTHMFLYETNLL